VRQAQYLIAYSVPQGIVDIFEVVQIKEQHRQQSILVICRQCVIQCVDEMQSIG
jgi:hypothetical protein